MVFRNRRFTYWAEISSSLTAYQKHLPIPARDFLVMPVMRSMKMYTFRKRPNNKIFLRNISFTVYAKDSTKPMYKSVMNSNIQPIAAAFDIKAFSKDSQLAV